LETDVYWPPFDGVSELTEATFKDKAEIIAKLLDNLTQVPYRDTFSDEFGDLIYEGPVLKLLNDVILPKAEQKAP